MVLPDRDTRMPEVEGIDRELDAWLEPATVTLKPTSKRAGRQARMRIPREDANGYRVSRWRGATADKAEP